MAEIVLRGVTKKFGNVTAVNNLSLVIPDGEFLAILGPSGCGKTTLLRLIAGFEVLTSGEILVGGISVDELAPNRRNIGIVFQNFALFPHKTIYQNIEFGLRMRKIPKAKRHEMVMEVLSLIHLADAKDRYPSQISGGQQQRVALARAVVIKPTMLLLDEPLGALDKKLREEMQVEVKRIQKQLGITTLYVTHDQEEALTMADTIAIMKSGVIEQRGKPLEVYEKPATPFVANFIGNSNILEGIVRQVNHQVRVEWAGGIFYSRPTPGIKQGDKVFQVLRPEKVVLSEEEPPSCVVNKVRGIIADIIYVGSYTTYLIEIPGLEKKLMASLQNSCAHQFHAEKAEVWFTWNLEDAPPLLK